MSCKGCIYNCPNCCCDCEYYVERIYYTGTLPFCLVYRRYCTDIKICEHYKTDKRAEQIEIEEITKG